MTRQATLFEDDERPVEPKRGLDLWTPERRQPPRREVQKLLLTGLDCLPGQRDLFSGSA